MANKQNPQNSQSSTPAVIAVGGLGLLLYLLSNGAVQQAAQVVQSCCAGK